jgi:SagB-type dehydrogenase family enzyme
LTPAPGAPILFVVDIGRRFQSETSYPAPEGIELPPLRPAGTKAESVVLPPPPAGGPGLWSVIARRRSRRQYSGEALGAEELSAVLWAAQGLTATDKGHALRAAPSAGGLYALDLYAALPGPAPAAGLYRYEPAGHCLWPILLGPVCEGLALAALDQRFLARAGAILVLTAHPDRSAWRYEQRSWRYFYLDAGGIGENAQLAAEARGLWACAIGAFHDAAVNELLGLDGENELAVYMIAVGRPAGPAAVRKGESP